MSNPPIFTIVSSFNNSISTFFLLVGTDKIQLFISNNFSNMSGTIYTLNNIIYKELHTLVHRVDKKGNTNNVNIYRKSFF